MTGATHLHWYQCSFCRAVATSPVCVKSHFRCRACGRLLAYQWSEPITTDALRERAKGGIVYSLVDPPTPPRPMPKKCRASGCSIYKPEAEMVNLIGIGHFCSQEHAEQGQREWDAFMDRLRKLKQEQPDLWPAATTGTEA